MFKSKHSFQTTFESCSQCHEEVPKPGPSSSHWEWHCFGNSASKCNNWLMPVFWFKGSCYQVQHQWCWWTTCCLGYERKLVRLRCIAVHMQWFAVHALLNFFQLLEKGIQNMRLNWMHTYGPAQTFSNWLSFSHVTRVTNKTGIPSNSNCCTSCAFLLHLPQSFHSILVLTHHL